MKNLNLSIKAQNVCICMALVLVMAMFVPSVNAAGKLDWMPAQLDDTALNSQDLGGEQILPEIVITNTPKLTADLSIFTRTYVLELKKFNISNDGTNADETSKGINDSLQYAKVLGADRIVFPKGTYLISENTPIIINHANTVIDLNGATLQMRTNALPKYNIVKFVEGAKNARLTNGTIRGDRETHDLSNGRSHEWGHCLVFNGGENLEVDNLTLSYGTGDGVSSRIGNRIGAKAQAIYPKEIEKGAINDKGVKVDSTEKTRTIKAYDVSMYDGEMEFGYSGGYLGYPFIKGRVYQAYFYDSKMKFIKMEKALQFRKVAIPAGAKFTYLEFNQPEVSDIPIHAGADEGSYAGNISNFKAPRDVHFHHNTLYGNRRLGMAYCGGRKWVIENNHFEKNGATIDGIRGTAPAYAIDFEDGWEFMQDVVVRNNSFKDNKAGDLVICAGSEILVEGNVFESNVVLHGRPHNYTFRNNKYTGGNIRYKTRTGIAKIHDNTYENCNLSIVFDSKAVADGLNHEEGKVVVTPPLTLVNETMTNISTIKGTYFNFINCKLTNANLVAGEQTSMVNLSNCQLDKVSLEYQAKGPDVLVKIKDCKGQLDEKGAGLSRKK